jgi:hypothetical protein
VRAFDHLDTRPCPERRRGQGVSPSREHYQQHEQARGLQVHRRNELHKIYALTDRSRSGHATEVKEFAPTVEFKNPNGTCFSKDGFLYSVEQNRVLQFPAAKFFYESPDVAVSPIVKQGDLIPSSEESFNHSARACAVGPDSRLSARA